MKVRSVDERDTRWESEFPAYRVYFWENSSGPPHGWSSYPYELTDVHNVQQVLAWADANARGRTYQVFAVAGSEADVGLLHLCGSTPTRPGDPRAEPPAELRAEAELEGAAYLEQERQRAEDAARGPR